LPLWNVQSHRHMHRHRHRHRHRHMHMHMHRYRHRHRHRHRHRNSHRHSPMARVLLPVVRVLWMATIVAQTEAQAHAQT